MRLRLRKRGVMLSSVVLEIGPAGNAVVAAVSESVVALLRRTGRTCARDLLQLFSLKFTHSVLVSKSVAISSSDRRPASRTIAPQQGQCKAHVNVTTDG